MPAYNNYFPVNYPYQQNPYQVQYQQQYPQMIQSQQPQQPQQQVQQVQQSGMLWVANELEAQNYPVAPNNAVALWDSTKSAVYIKQADASGKPLMKVYELVERSAIPQKAEQESKLEDFVKKSELAEMLETIDLMKSDLRNIKKEIGRRKKEAVEDDE